MKLLPVVGRELRASARRPSAYWVRTASAMAGLAAMGYVALVGAAGLPTANQGRSLFDLLSLGAFAYCLMAGVRGTSDALSQEKREGTLGLLFLTDLKGYDVVCGKLLSVSINSIYGILAMAPVLALAFMMGGTSGLQFLTMLVLLFNTLFYSLSVGILVSTFSEQDRPAMGGTLAIVFLTLTLPYGIAAAHSFGVLELWEVMEPGFLLASPFFAFSTIKSPTELRIYFDDVASSLVFTHLSGWLCIVVASASVAQRAYSDAPRGKLMAWIARIQHEWAFGKAARRQVIRRALLDRNAFAWVAGRDRLKQRYAWMFLILLAGLFAVARWKAPEVTEEWPVIMFALWFVHLFFKVWVASEVAARFIEDRRSNALELLLTTPLALREFVSGQRIALLRQFGPPIALIIALNLFVGWRASDSSSYMIRSPVPMQFFIAGLLHLVFDLYAIQWVSIWRSMNLRGANRTIIQTVGLIIFLPFLGWLLLWQVSWVLSIATKRVLSAQEILWIWTTLCIIYNLLLSAVARHFFFQRFREVATTSFSTPQPFRWKRRPAAPTPAIAAAAEKRRPRKWSWPRKAAIGCAICLVGFYVAMTIRRMRLEAQVNRRLIALRAAQMPVAPADVPTWKPGPEARESASVALREASKLVSRSAQRTFLPDHHGQWHTRERLPAEVKARLTTTLAEQANVFRVLEDLVHRKPGGGSIAERYRTVIQTDDLVRVLQVKARVEMEDDPAKAAVTITTLLHLVRALQGEHIAAFAGSRKGMEAARDLFQRAAAQGNFSTDDWQAWKDVLQQMNPTASLRDHLIVERADGLSVFFLPADELFLRFGRPMGNLSGVFNVSWSLRRLIGQDKAEMVDYLDHMEECIADSERPFWEVKKRNLRPSSWRAPTATSASFITPHILPGFDWLLTSATELTAFQRILMTVCDVEIHKAKHGDSKLDYRVPTLARIDPFTGATLIFVPREDGYSIYSVGQDGRNDGGVRATGRQTGDIAYHFGNPPERPRIIKKP